LLNPDAFFPALDALTDPARLAESRPSTDEAVYQWAVATVLKAGLLSESGFLEAQLALHAAVPKIEAFYQQRGSVSGLPGSEECRSWVEWYGDIICDLDTLAHRIGHATIGADNSTETARCVIPTHFMCQG
jgi:UDP-glucose:glycoprotein glucosyltransferase